MRKKNIGFEFASGINWNAILYGKVSVVNHTVDRWKKQVKTSTRIIVVDECSETDRKSARSVYIDHYGPYVMSSQKFYHDGFRKKIYLNIPAEYRIPMTKRISEVKSLLETN